MRTPCLLAVATLLTACAGEPAPALPTLAAPASAAKQPAKPEPVITGPALSGRLLTPPAGSEVELALLLVDSRGRPLRALGSQTLQGNGQPLAFRLPLVQQTPASAERIELRARVSQSGRLILRLPPVVVDAARGAELGPLQLVRAP